MTSSAHQFGQAPSRLVLIVGAGGAVGGFAGLSRLSELLSHRFVALGELLDGEGVGLVVRQAKIISDNMYLVPFKKTINAYALSVIVRCR